MLFVDRRIRLAGNAGLLSTPRGRLMEDVSGFTGLAGAEADFVALPELDLGDNEFGVEAVFFISRLKFFLKIFHIILERNSIHFKVKSNINKP